MTRSNIATSAKEVRTGLERRYDFSNAKDNNTWALVKDIEKLREHVQVNRWVVFGGSWGATLSLIYAETHHSRVSGLILRGVFTMRREELLWLYQKSASRIFPHYWKEFIAPLPEVERGDVISAYYRCLTGDNEEEKLVCAKAWSKWELATAFLQPSHDFTRLAEDGSFALQFALIECILSHYFVHGGFLHTNDQILRKDNRPA